MSIRSHWQSPPSFQQKSLWVPGSKEREDSSSPHLSVMFQMRSATVLPLGTRSSTSPFPTILLRSRIVWTFTEINAQTLWPSSKGGPIISGKHHYFRHSKKKRASFTLL